MARAGKSPKSRLGAQKGKQGNVQTNGQGGGLIDLAFAAYRAGDREKAEEICADILAKSPHDKAALSLMAQGALEKQDLKAAQNILQKLVDLDPENGVAWKNLAWVFDTTGNAPRAESAYREALKRITNDPLIYHNVGVLMQRQKRYGEAIPHYQKAVLLDPELKYVADSALQLARILADQGHYQHAAEIWLSMLHKRPQDDRVMGYLAYALKQLGKDADALNMAIQALAHNPDSVHNQTFFVLCLRYMTFSAYREDVFKTLEYCLIKGQAGFQEIFPTWRSLLVMAPDFAEIAPFFGGGATAGKTDSVAAALGALFPTAVTPASDAIRMGMVAQLCHSYVRYGLKYSLVHDADCETGLTVLRRALLEVCLNGTETGRDDAAFWKNLRPFISALAEQCFYNEYVFAETPQEAEQVRTLRERLAHSDLAAAFEAPEANTNAAVLCDLALFACYRPLYRDETFATVLQPALDAITAADEASIAARGAGDVMTIVIEAFANPKAEQALRADIRSLAPIDDDVSRAVREQYEENPYPRWRTMNSFNVRGAQAALKDGAVETLIAGCGTGRHALMVAVQNPDSRITALDLSMTSLSYAARKIGELGVKNIELVQGDILKAEALGKTFDHIESAGVLHHMDDPMAGWRVLTRMLAPGGTMKIALYSELARAVVVEMRALIAAQKFTPDDAGIRKARAYVAGLEGGHILKTLRMFRDYDSISGCRDLIFHVQEHRFTLPQIKACVAELGLVFKGMNIGDPHLANLYRAQCPHDKSFNDFEALDAFERMHPKTFSGMYQFDLMKPLAAPDAAQTVK